MLIFAYFLITSFNHDFYWKSMKPGGGGKPSGALAAAIDKDFGSFDNFRKEFTVAANTAFGSGWAWLVKTPSGALKVTKTIGEWQWYCTRVQ